MNICERCEEQPAYYSVKVYAGSTDPDSPRFGPDEVVDLCEECHERHEIDQQREAAYAEDRADAERDERGEEQED